LELVEDACLISTLAHGGWHATPGAAAGTERTTDEIQITRVVDALKNLVGLKAAKEIVYPIMYVVRATEFT
jgi:hypothetical protein